MTSFGRGLQPSFTIEYRAMVGEGDKLYATDKYFCGSYKDFMPDHYQIGYQIASYAYNKYDKNIANDIASYTANYPFTVFTSTIALKKYYNTSTTKLLDETYSDLRNLWNSLPKEDNSSTFIETPPITSYTIYDAPTKINDSIVVAIKKDLDKSKRIVEINLNSGEEQILKYVGNTNSQPIYRDGKLYWSEYRNSTLWQQRVGSVVCSYDFETKKLEHSKESYNAIYPAPMDQDVAYVEYKCDGSYSIISRGVTWDLPFDIAIYGLAYDNKSQSLYFLALDQSGMWIGRCNSDGTYSPLTKGSASTLSRLKAGSGKLYFNSIQSGKDEVHMYDLYTNKEWQVTTSTYGSFDGTPSNDDKHLTMTTYATAKSGYLPAIQSLNVDSMKVVEYSYLPSSRMNPSRKKWDVTNIDSVYIDTLSRKEIGSRPYRKGTHLFNIHSWAPISLDPDDIVSSDKFNILAGVTLMSQNLLSSTNSFLRYGWTDKGSLVAGGINYLALPVKFEVKAKYGGGDQNLNVDSYPLALKSHFDINGRVYLPMTLSSGYHLRYLTPSISLYHDNTVMPNRGGDSYSNSGIQSLTASLMYVENVRMAFRDIRPKLGYALRVSHAVNPFRDDFSSSWRLFARGYLPGVARQHSLMLRGTVQSQDTKMYSFRGNDLSPRGSNFNLPTKQYMAVAVDYQLPLCYPDGGISSLIYFSRIRLNLTGDYARYKNLNGELNSLTSYGGEIIFDINPIRLPASTKTAVSISIYKPSNKSGVVIGGGISLPI